MKNQIKLNSFSLNPNGALLYSANIIQIVPLHIHLNIVEIEQKVKKKLKIFLSIYNKIKKNNFTYIQFVTIHTCKKVLGKKLHKLML